jgi:hypothetical protein
MAIFASVSKDLFSEYRVRHNQSPYSLGVRLPHGNFGYAMGRRKLR